MIHNIDSGYPHSTLLTQRLWFGPLMTLLTLLGIEVLSRTIYRVPTPGAVLLIPVAYATFVGGLRSGLISAAFLFLYALHFFSVPGQLFTYTRDNVKTIIVLTTTSLIMAGMLGNLKRQIDHLLHHNHLLLNSAGEGICGLDAQGVITFLNPAAAKMVGWTMNELVGRHVSALLKEPHTNAELLVTNAPIEATLYTKVSATVSDTLFWRSDGTPFAVEYVSSPIWERGRCTGLVITFNDITERKHVEEAKANFEANLVQAQKMESVGQLAGGIAHDFNNLLTAINGYAELLLQAHPEESIERGDVEAIRHAAHRAGELTQHLLAFARRQVIDPKVIQLNDLLPKMALLIHRLMGEDIEVETYLASDLHLVRADPGQIEQVILNLVVNARDAMPNGGRLILETANSTLDGSYASQHVVGIPGDYVMISVSDTGVGMPVEVREHIFEPFFTTKEVGKGTGLGLASCYGIVKQHGGNIWVYSEAGQGTTFKIYLPAVDALADTVAKEHETTAAPHGAEIVMLVEDEPSVLALTSRALRTLGYVVLEARNGADALFCIQENPDKPIDLLVTDMVMPHMYGNVLAEHVRSVYPLSRVLYISGYTNNAIVKQGQLCPGKNFLSKPFTPSTIAQKVREVLDA